MTEAVEAGADVLSPVPAPPVLRRPPRWAAPAFCPFAAALVP